MSSTPAAVSAAGAACGQTRRVGHYRVRITPSAEGLGNRQKIFFIENYRILRPVPYLVVLIKIAKTSSNVFS
jgi:hypothetical protein